MEILRRTAFCAIAIVVAGSLSAGDDKPAPPDTRLEVEIPSNVMRNGAEFQARVLMDTFVDGTQGWSLGVAHDPAELEYLSNETGELLATVRGGDPVDFLVINDTPDPGDGVTMAVVFSFVAPVTVDAGENYELLKINYRLLSNFETAFDEELGEDVCTPGSATIAFSNELHTPAVSNVITVNGESTTPELVGAEITVECPPDNLFEFTRCDGDTDNVYLEWQFDVEPAWDFAFLYKDGEFLIEVPKDLTSYTDEGLEPGDYEYTLVTFIVSPDAPDAPILVSDHCIATVIPLTVDTLEPTSGHFLGGDLVTITGQAFTTAEMTTVEFFAEGEDPLALEVVEVLSESELTAITPASPRLGGYSLRLTNERGFAELADAYTYGFTRGEINNDGNTDLSDGVVILSFLFRGETDTPACLDAADTNDDARIDVSDAIRIFAFLFVGGPPPLPPFESAGADPTDNDPFGCLDGGEIP